MRPFIALSLALALAACGGEDQSSPTPTPTPIPTPTPTPVPTPTPTGPPVAFAPYEQPLIYTPDTRHIYYTPGRGTSGLFYTAFDAPQMYGSPFPSGFVVQVQMSKVVAKFNADGAVAWSRPSAGRFVAVSEGRIFVSGSNSTNIVEILSPAGELLDTLTFDKPLNYATIVGDKLIVAYNTTDIGADVFAWDGKKGALLFTTAPTDYARSVALKGDLIAVADTFGHRVVIQNIVSGNIEAEIPSYFPNDLQWVGEYLYYVEEHKDRIIAYRDGKRTVVMAPPNPALWEPDAEQEMETCGTLVPPRSKSSDQCSGMFTLYAPNGFHVTGRGIFVADTDNSRVIYAEGGRVRSVLVGFNNAVKIVPL